MDTRQRGAGYSSCAPLFFILYYKDLLVARLLPMRAALATYNLDPFLGHDAQEFFVGELAILLLADIDQTILTDIEGICRPPE